MIGRQKAPTTENSRQKTKNDVRLIVTLLLLLAVATLALLLFRTEGDSVTVTVDGKLWGEFSLLEDRVVEIKNGDDYNRLIIRDGKAYVEYASCPDGICAALRPVSYGGESIICLPNKVVIEVHTADNDRPDIIA